MSRRTEARRRRLAARHTAMAAAVNRAAGREGYRAPGLFLPGLSRAAEKDIRKGLSQDGRKSTLRRGLRRITSRMRRAASMAVSPPLGNAGAPYAAGQGYHRAMWRGLALRRRRLSPTIGARRRRP